jgi:hypothetical protein
MKLTSFVSSLCLIFTNSKDQKNYIKERSRLLKMNRYVNKVQKVAKPNLGAYEDLLCYIRPHFGLFFKFVCFISKFE